MKSNREKGAVLLIEATLILPIVFIVVFLMIMVGEAYYQNARVEYAVTKAVISGAAQCENPMLSYIESHNNSVPDKTNAVKIRPYRYILTSEAEKIDSEIRTALKKSVEGQKPILWSGMSPKNVEVSGPTKINPLISSIQIQCDFDIVLPIRMIFSKENFKIHYSVSMVQTIGDPAELVRNVSTVGDMMERYKATSDIKNSLNNMLNNMASKVGKYLN